MKKLKPYSCPNCYKKLPLKYIFLLGNNSDVTCSGCGMISVPENMGNWALPLGFLSFTIPFELIRYNTRSFKTAIVFGLLTGLTFYFGILIYVYKKVLFRLNR